MKSFLDDDDDDEHDVYVNLKHLYNISKWILIFEYFKNKIDLNSS